MELAEPIAWAISFFATAIAAIKGLSEIRSTREQRKVEFRWKQAQLAKTVLDETWADHHCRSAFTMLDWDGRKYRDGERETGIITRALVARALRTDDVASFSRDEAYVRDAFDQLFDAATRTEHFIKISLINFSDIEHRWAYYVSLLARDRPVVERFLVEYKYGYALDFVSRFEAWGKQPGRT